ncbi:hypothetical protein GW17_00007207 [Ensete ventricosum]|nr:hypothetical protein GW17_00007207 [Ensete ventricosum]RZR92271.1 hypothetical protein BHM03_00020524 [Ensete ventricosum]
MASWRRSLGNLRAFVGNATGGLRGGANLASWVVAGTLAYFLWVKPAQDLKREQEVIPVIIRSSLFRIRDFGVLQRLTRKIW